MLAYVLMNVGYWVQYPAEIPLELALSAIAPTRGEVTTKLRQREESEVWWSYLARCGYATQAECDGVFEYWKRLEYLSHAHNRCYPVSTRCLFFRRWLYGAP